MQLSRVKGGDPDLGEKSMQHTPLSGHGIGQVLQALQPSRNFCETQEIRPFSRSISLQKFGNYRNLKKFKLFEIKMPFLGGNYSLGAPCMCAHYFHLRNIVFRVAKFV